jgi:hypothetical protein
MHRPIDSTANRVTIPRRLGEIGLVLIFYSAIAVWWLWPLPAVWRTHSGYFGAEYPPSVADFYLIVWALAWDAHAITLWPWHPFRANIFYPSKDALAYSEHFLGYLPLFAPAYWVTGNPVLAANWTALITYPLCGVAMYLLARRFTGRPAALAAGFFYAFHLRRLQSLPHLHMLGVQYLPLVLLLTERWFEAARMRDLLFLTIALMLQALSSFYLAYALFLAYGTYVALALVRWRTTIDRRRVVGIAAASAILVGAVIATAAPYVKLKALGLIPSYGNGEDDVIGLIPYFAQLKVREYLAEGGPPVVGYVLAALAFVPLGRRGAYRWGAAIGGALAVVGIVAAFGPAIMLHNHKLWSPYQLLLDSIPGFATVRLPDRFVVVAQLGFALLAGIGAGRVLDRAPRFLAWTGAALAIAVALVAFAGAPALPVHPERTGEHVPPVYRWLDEHGAGRALLELPGGGFPVAARHMYFSTYHWLPLIDGYSGYPPGTAQYIYWLGRDLPNGRALQELVDHVDVGWILVHRDELTEDQAQRWDAPLPEGLALAGEWGGDLLLRVDRGVERDRRSLLLNKRVTLGGVPLAPLGDSCPGRIELVDPPPDPWAPRSTARLVVKINNDGQVPWPGLGFYPRHLVRLRLVLLGPRGRAGPVIRVPLLSDVPPGGEVTVTVPVAAPISSAEYSLEIALFQVLDGPLASCGVEPLRIPVRVGMAP